MMAAAARRAKQKPIAEKPKAKETSTPEQSGPDEHGLWVDTAFFRSLTRRTPRTVLHPQTEEEENYFLKLADVALGRPKEKRKSDRRPIAFPKAHPQFKKYK